MQHNWWSNKNCWLVNWWWDIYSHRGYYRWIFSTISMPQMSGKELYLVVAGSSKISGTLLNSVSKLINTLLDFGRVIGSSIRYLISGRSC